MPQGMPGSEQTSQTKFAVFGDFQKMDTAAARTGLPLSTVAWWENLQPLAPNKLQVVPAPQSAPLQSLPENISLAYYATLNGQDYVILFTTAGAGWYINLTTGAIPGQFAPDGTFSQSPDCTVWQGQRILINDPVSGYSTWDGANLFVQQGGVSPNMFVTAGGANYLTPPPVSLYVAPTAGQTGGVCLITITNPGAFTAPAAGTVNLTFTPAPGDGGSGAAGTATVANNQVVGVNITNPGFGYAVPPSVKLSGTVTPAGGAPTFAVSIGIASVQNIAIVAGGSFSTPAAGTYALPIAAPLGTGGVQATGTVTITGTAPNCTVASVAVTNPGAGYGGPPAITLATGGGTVSAVNTTTHVITCNGHGFAINQDVVFTGTGSIANITKGTRYFVIAANFTANAFQVSTSLGGSAVNAGALTTPMSVAVFHPPAFIVTMGANGATASSALGSGPTAGEVTNLTLTNPGQGFNATDNVTVVFASTGGSGAQINVRAGNGGAAGVNGMSGSSMLSCALTAGGQAGSGSYNPGAGPDAGLWPCDVDAPPTGGTQAAVSFATTSNAAGNYVSAVFVRNAGSGYASVPIVKAKNAGAGFATVPAFTPTMSPQHVQSPLQIAKNGTGYPPNSTLPLVFTGDQGAPQATGTCTTDGAGTITGTNLLTGGAYPLNSSRPSINVAVGGGAAGQAHVWPFVPAGSTLAVWQGRVWLGGGTLLQWTGTGATYNNVGYDDFLQQDASASLQIVDADLVHQISALRSLNNYLWIIGDQSVKMIGAISVTGEITNFQIVTLSSDQGTIWPKSVISYNRITMFANPNGIYGVFGSTVQKLSDDLDGIFQAMSASLQPQGAVVDLRSRHNAVFLLRYVDPVAGMRSLLIMFDGKKWWLANQGAGVGVIFTRPNVSTDLNELWGSLTHTDVTQLFARPDIAQPVKLATSLSHQGEPYRGKRVIRSGFTADALAPANINIEIDGDSTVNQNVLAVTGTSLLVGGANDANNNPMNSAGVYIGATITGTLVGLFLQNVILEYQDAQLWKGA